MAWGEYDVYDRKTQQVILLRARRGEIAKAIGCTLAKVSTAIQNGKNGTGTWIIDNRYEIIGNETEEFEVRDENGFYVPFSEEWDKTIREFKEIYNQWKKKQVAR